MREESVNMSAHACRRLATDPNGKIHIYYKFIGIRSTFYTIVKIKLCIVTPNNSLIRPEKL